MSSHRWVLTSRRRMVALLPHHSLSMNNVWTPLVFASTTTSSSSSASLQHSPPSSAKSGSGWSLKKDASPKSPSSNVVPEGKQLSHPLPWSVDLPGGKRKNKSGVPSPPEGDASVPDVAGRVKFEPTSFLASFDDLTAHLPSAMERLYARILVPNNFAPAALMELRQREGVACWNAMKLNSENESKLQTWLARYDADPKGTFRPLTDPRQRLRSLVWRLLHCHFRLTHHKRIEMSQLQRDDLCPREIKDLLQQLNYATLEEYCTADTEYFKTEMTFFVEGCHIRRKDKFTVCSGHIYPELVEHINSRLSKAMDQFYRTNPLFIMEVAHVCCTGLLIDEGMERDTLLPQPSDELTLSAFSEQIPLRDLGGNRAAFKFAVLEYLKKRKDPLGRGYFFAKAAVVEKRESNQLRVLQLGLGQRASMRYSCLDFAVKALRNRGEVGDDRARMERHLRRVIGALELQLCRPAVAELAQTTCQTWREFLVPATGTMDLWNGKIMKHWTSEVKDV